jgi:hypothetical protein
MEIAWSALGSANLSQIMTEENHTERNLKINLYDYYKTPAQNPNTYFSLILVILLRGALIHLYVPRDSESRPPLFAEGPAYHSGHLLQR